MLYIALRLFCCIVEIVLVNMKMLCTYLRKSLSFVFCDFTPLRCTVYSVQCTILKQTNLIYNLIKLSLYYLYTVQLSTELSNPVQCLHKTGSLSVYYLYSSLRSCIILYNVYIRLVLYLYIISTALYGASKPVQCLHKTGSLSVYIISTALYGAV